MNQATNVNIVPSYGQRGDLHFSQYDVGRTATINLYAVNEAYTIPLGATVKIQATKPSGLGFDVACTFSGSVVTVVSTETMTAEAGRFPAELHIIDNSDIIGTANFMFVVEASPHPDGTVDGDAEEVVNEIKALVLESEGYALGTQDGVPVDSSSVYYHNNAKWLSDNAILSDEVKQTLLQCFEKVAWIDGNGQTYYDALQTALNRGAELLSISAVYTQSETVYKADSLDFLKNDLVVTANYDDQTTETVITYTLSGTLEIGTSTITVSYGGKTTTFSVTVTDGYELRSAFESTGSNSIATDMYFQKDSTITIAEEFVATTIPTQPEIDFVFGNKPSSSVSDYLGVQINKFTSGANVGKYLWGFGIAWSDGKNIIDTNQTIRLVQICTISNNGMSASVSTSYKNLTTSTSNTYSNNYTTSNIDYETNPIVIGNTFDNNGFIGTLNKFIIYKGTWTAEQIAEFLG